MLGMNNFNLKQYLTENKLLQEIKVKKPGTYYFDLNKIDKIYQESEDYNEEGDNPFPFGGVNNISDIGPDEIPFDIFKQVIDEEDILDLNELEVAALYLKILSHYISNGYYGSEEVMAVFNEYFPTNPNRRQILKWLNIEEDLQEIKVNKPGVNFYFEREDDWSYSYNDNQGVYYLFPHDEGDEYMIMSSHLDDELDYGDMEGAPEIDENNPEEIDDLISFIEGIDPTYGTQDLRSMINNFRKYKIPINEFNLQGDGGYIYINLVIRYQDILPYIKK
jgi:hypothetical protein